MSGKQEEWSRIGVNGGGLRGNLFFYYSLTYICNPMVDTLIPYHRGGHVKLVGENLFLRHIPDSDIGHLGGNERMTSGGNGPRSSSNV